MSLRRLMLPALLMLALFGCTTQPPSLCQPLILPGTLMQPPQGLRSLPSPQQPPKTTQPATPTLNG